VAKISHRQRALKVRRNMELADLEPQLVQLAALERRIHLRHIIGNPAATAPR